LIDGVVDSLRRQAQAVSVDLRKAGMQAGKKEYWQKDVFHIVKVNNRWLILLMNSNEIGLKQREIRGVPEAGYSAAKGGYNPMLQ
jgi:hypothetical protein